MCSHLVPSHNCRFSIRNELVVTGIEPVTFRSRGNCAYHWTAVTTLVSLLFHESQLIVDKRKAYNRPRIDRLYKFIQSICSSVERLSALQNLVVLFFYFLQTKNEIDRLLAEDFILSGPCELL